ncbi:MAG: hypothetical protein SWK76_02235 [Actinomycetota bacterium]|nr:hypothetical protein [Actinomycetota bacterium]
MKQLTLFEKLTFIALLCFLLSTLLIGLAVAQENQEGEQATEEGQAMEVVEEEVEEPLGPQVDWGDYRYTFTAVGPSSDLDPQSVLMNWFTPDLYKANWSGANYVHLYINIDWLNNDRSLDYMPLQLVLVNGGSRYILFGKGCSNASYIWRRGNHYVNDLGCRYPDHVGGDAKIFFTFDTNGAAIDPNSAYIEVQGMLEVWDWDLNSKLYTTHQNNQGYFQDLRWGRNGSSYFTYTHLANIPLSEILPE